MKYRLADAAPFAVIMGSFIGSWQPTLTWAESLFFSADLEQLEHRFIIKDEDAITAQGRISYGGDDWKIHSHLKSEHIWEDRVWESVELQGYISIPVAQFWDIYGGVRHDIRPRPSRTYAGAGFSGLAPYFIETDVSLFLSEKGAISSRMEAETDILITQRLILQPLVEMNLALSDDKDIDIGSGLVSTELGSRLRYEITRDVAPYIGINYERLYGQTARFAKDEGEAKSSFSLLAGIKLSY